MRACCRAQRVIVFRSIHTAEVATSTARLKSGADDSHAKQYVGRAEIFAPPAFRTASTSSLARRTARL
jgi:hypothetical protein